MRFRTVVLAAALASGIVHTSDAFVRQRGGDATQVAAGDGPRMHRTTRFVHTVPSLAGWHGIWDHDTDVPLRLWGPSIPVANAIQDPAVAESAARAFLAAHLDVLAPGAQPSDFVLVANTVTDGLRSIGFEQHANGMRVIGGAIGFGFLADRLFTVSSTALPHIAVAAPAAALARTTLAARATAWLRDDGFGVRPTISAMLGATAERVIIPIVRPRGNASVDVRYHVAEQLPVEEMGGIGQWDVWLDAGDGAPIVRKSKLMFATGTVLFDVPDQSPSGTRSPHVAPFVNHQVDGLVAMSSSDGVVTWADGNTATISPGLAGPYVSISNKSGSLATTSLMLPPNGSVTWSEASDPLADAQLDSYVYANAAKAWVRANLAPTLPLLDARLPVNVNLNQTCNAFEMNAALNFFVADSECENTGRIRDVVYHEFGHAVHEASIIAGVGSFDGSMSEGLADTLAVSITGDHGLGRGFFFNDMAIRELDPVGLEKRWPQDADGEVHDEGEIIGETLYDLRKALVAKLGDQAGFARFLKIYYTIMQRSSDIPSSYAEALVGDDDDGNLANGTPNLCEIDAAFGAHGLTDAASTLGFAAPTRTDYTVHLGLPKPTLSSTCPNATTVASMSVQWHVHGGPTDATVAFAPGATDFTAVIPTQAANSVVEYQVAIALSDGNTLKYPDNPADPYYQFYVGDSKVLWCADFENGASDWTHTGSPASRDEWQVGAPMGLGGDPLAAHAGTNAFGTDLTTDGTYRGNGTSSATSPDIDLQGFTNVHLQYYRWLTVEDGAYDQATIYANGAPVWANHGSTGMPATEVNHVDKEWRFADVDLSAQSASGKVALKFEIKADQGLNLGGWTIDDVCVVAIGAKPAVATCGNGVLETGEQCDDGNAADGDGCSATCETETAPMMTDGGGCCSTGSRPGGALALGALVAGVLRRRRRR